MKDKYDFDILTIKKNNYVTKPVKTVKKNNFKLDKLIVIALLLIIFIFGILAIDYIATAEKNLDFMIFGNGLFGIVIAMVFGYVTDK